MPIDTSGLTEHTLPILRRDFITTTHCAFCPRPLPSGTALILEHPALGELPAGTSCGPQWGIAPDKGFPDYTKLGLLPIDQNEIGESKGKASHRRYRPDREYLRNLEYLVLRSDKLPSQGFSGLEYPFIRRFYEILVQNGALTPEESTKLSRFIDSSAVQRTKYSHSALMLAYTHGYWLNQCLEKGQTKLRLQNYRRLESFKSQLLEKRTLSSRQIECLNHDLKFLFGDHAPNLDPECFTPYRPPPQQNRRENPTRASGKDLG